MARHLASCAARQAAIASAPPASDRRQYHLQLQEAYAGDYWLHLELDGSAPLKTLDQYLRAIWLECCGHGSELTDGGRKVPATRRAHQALKPGMELVHVYDFGDSSVTRIRVVAERRGGPLGRHPITLMARNAPRGSTCLECGGPASLLCMQCLIDDGRFGTLCPSCVGSHGHDDYGDPVPVVNSPRVGVCGYEGPAEPPY